MIDSADKALAAYVREHLRAFNARDLNALLAVPDPDAGGGWAAGRFTQRQTAGAEA